MNGAIGVFDSGVGGLSVLREIRAALPDEAMIYVADTAHAPYGGQPAAHIEARANVIAQFLIDQGAKAIVVACNTATAVAIDALRARFAVPFVGIEPAVKPAAARTCTGVVGVLATKLTLGSARFGDLADQHARHVRVLTQACPQWVELVERGELTGDNARRAVEQCVRPLLAQGADQLVLGCTHFPFLAPLVAEVAGPTVNIIDPAEAVARELVRRLIEDALRAPAANQGTVAFFSSAEPEAAEALLSRLWGEPVCVKTCPG